MKIGEFLELSDGISSFVDSVKEHTPSHVVIQDMAGSITVHSIFLIQNGGLSDILIQDTDGDSYLNYKVFLEKKLARRYAFVK